MNESARAERYNEAAISDEIKTLANTTSGRNAALNKAAFVLGGFVVAGVLREEEAIAHLLNACETNGYARKDGPAAVRASIKSGLKKGMETPRVWPRSNGADQQAPNGPNRTASRPRQALSEFARERELPSDALHRLGWRDTPRGIAIPYTQRDGSPARTQYREPTYGNQRFAWDPEGEARPIVAYEPDGGALAREKGFVLVCEGTSDTVTSIVAGFPALGIPGANMVRKTLKAEHVEGLARVFVCVDTDASGEPDARGRDVSSRRPRAAQADWLQGRGARAPHAWCEGHERPLGAGPGGLRKQALRCDARG